MALVPVADCYVSLYPDAVGFLSPVLWLWAETWPAGSPCVCVSSSLCALCLIAQETRCFPSKYNLCSETFGFLDNKAAVGL